MAISRRNAIKSIVSASVCGVTGAVLAKTKLPVIEDNPRESYKSNYSETLYRTEFKNSYGKKKDHGYAYHCVNCQGNCAWEVWIKDGKVTRENQSRSYPLHNPKIPDFNPRGCNKGAQHSQFMYEADRLLYPMKRAGKRGEGKWTRISWDEAIDEVAQKLYDNLTKKGPASNYIHMGAGVLSEARGASVKRLGTLLGAVRPYIASYVGDMFPGTSVVYGEGNIGCTYDFHYQANVNVWWGCNPNQSRIPDAHFLWEGKYNGAKNIVISPDFNSTCIHADLWVPIKPGYDGHLALSIMNEIITHKMYDSKFLKEFTDLPILVRVDTKEMLRLSDIKKESEVYDQEMFETLEEKSGDKEDHGHEVFFTYNNNNKKVTVMPGCEGSAVETIRLKDQGWDIDPALEGTWEIELKDGKKVKVTTVFTLMKKELGYFNPKEMAKVTGVPASIVKILAQDLTRPKIAMVTIGFSIGKYFNGMLNQRAISSLTALTGRLGPRGGLETENEWSIDGLGGLSGFGGEFRHRFGSGFVSEYVLGGQDKSNDDYFKADDVEAGSGVSKSEYDKEKKHMLESYKGDANVGKGKSFWDSCDLFMIFADARFRRNKGHYKEAFLKQAEYLVYGDFRMSDFAMYADLLLPCKSHYEVWDLRTNPGYHRYANIAHPPANLNPVGESKSEWEISTLVAERLEVIANREYKKSGDKKAILIEDKSHTNNGYRDLSVVGKTFTNNGALRTDKDAVEFALKEVKQFGGNTTKTMWERGGYLTLNEQAGKTSPLYPDKPYNFFENNLYLRQRFHTMTGRITFYVDHHLWIKTGAHVPTAKEPIAPKRYPFLLQTPHARWSIHSTYKTSTILQRMQRGKPYIMVNPKVGKKLGFKDGDDVLMKNDFGTCQVMAKLTSNVPLDCIVMEHGWEPFMFKDQTGQNQIMGDMINLLELSDGWGHLKFGVNWDGNQHAYETTVDIVKA